MTEIDMLDTIGANAQSILSIPARHRPRVAAYVTGTGGVRWDNAQIGELLRSGTQTVVRIDQQVGPIPVTSAAVFDIENGADSLVSAVQSAKRRKNAGLRSTFYFSSSLLGQVHAAVMAAGLLDWVDYWLADWGLTRQQAVELLGSPVVAVQWTSPTSDPDMLVPGTRRTLREANIDLSVTLASWPADLTPKRRPSVKPHPKVAASAIAGVIVTALQALAHAKGVGGWRITPAESAAITTFAMTVAGWLKKA